MNPSPHYRWYVVALTLVNQAISIGILVYSFALFVVPWLETFGISRSVVMSAVFLMQLTNGLLSPLIGRFLDQYSIRNLILTGGLCIVSGLLLTSLMDEFWQIILIHMTLLPIGMVLCGTLSSQTLVGKWFITERGIAIGISAAGTSIGGFLFPLITAELIGSFDWRTALQLLAGLALVTIVPLNLLILRVPPPARPVLETGQDSDAGYRVWSSREILTTPMFWIPIAGLLPMNLSFAAVQFNLGAYVADLGYEQALAAQLIAIGSLSMIIGKFVFGGLGDRIDHRFLFWTMSLSLMVSLVLYQGSPGRSALTAAAVMQGIATGGVMPMMGNAYAARFGTLSFGKVLGFVNLFTMMGSFGSLLSGWAYDLTQTYDYVFWSLMVVLLPCAVIMYWLPPVSSRTE